MKKITIIVPCYNEQAMIKPFYQELKKYIDNPNYKFTVLFVDDGSLDATRDEIKELIVNDNRVEFIGFSRNFGKEAAMHAGMEKSQNEDAIIMIDADLQHPPALINEMIDYYEQGYKIVYTRQKSRRGEPFLRTFFANRFYKIFNKYSDVRIESGAKDFQLLDKKVIKAFLKLDDNNRFVKGIFSWVGFKRKCIEFDYVERLQGKTKWSFKGLLVYAFNGINQFSSILMFAPTLALILAILAIPLNVILYIFDSVDFKTFILLIEVNIFSVFLFSLIYFLYYLLYQVRKQVMNRPIFIIEEESND